MAVFTLGRHWEQWYFCGVYNLIVKLFTVQLFIDGGHFTWLHWLYSTGPERRLVMLENKLVKCRMSQTLGGETVPFSFRMVEGLQSCTVFDVGLWNQASYLCVGTPTKLYLMKYNPNLAMYCVRKVFSLLYTFVVCGKGILSILLHCILCIRL